MPEETSEQLETVANDLSEIEAEPGVNGLGETIQETESLDYQAIASEAIDMAIYQELQSRFADNEEVEETTLSVSEIFEQDAEMQSIKASPMLGATQNPTMKEQTAYKLNLDGTEYYCWFPNGAELGITEDGYIYNETANNITGIISNSLNGVSLNSYNDTITISPLLTSSGNNNAYRYGSRIYINDYNASGGTLSYTTEYISSAMVIDKPGVGYGLSRFQISLLFVVCLVVVFSVLRFMWRDK